MLVLTIVPPKPLGLHLIQRGLLISGFIVEGLIKGEHLYIGYNITKCTSKNMKGWIDAGGTHDRHN
jgi:hypothetical protein